MKQSAEALAPVRSHGAMRTWLTRHVITCKESLVRMAKQPFASLMTILVIAVTLALPAAMHVVVKNAQSISGSWENALDFSIYMRADVSVDDAKTLAEIIQQRADVEAVVFVSADEALREFRDASGFGVHSN